MERTDEVEEGRLSYPTDHLVKQHKQKDGHSEHHGCEIQALRRKSADGGWVSNGNSPTHPHIPATTRPLRYQHATSESASLRDTDMSGSRPIPEDQLEQPGESVDGDAPPAARAPCYYCHECHAESRTAMVSPQRMPAQGTASDLPTTL